MTKVKNGKTKMACPFENHYSRTVFWAEHNIFAICPYENLVRRQGEENTTKPNSKRMLKKPPDPISTSFVYIYIYIKIYI